MAITQEVDLDILEKLPDGNHKLKYAKTRVEQVVGLQDLVNTSKIETSRDGEGNIIFSSIFAQNDTVSNVAFSNDSQGYVWQNLKTISIDTSIASIYRFSFEIQNPYFPITKLRIIDETGAVISDEITLVTPISVYAWQTIHLYNVPNIGVKNFILQFKAEGTKSMSSISNRSLNVTRNKINNVRGGA